MSEWKYYTISINDVGKTIDYMDNGLAIIKTENSEKLKLILNPILTKLSLGEQEK